MNTTRKSSAGRLWRAVAIALSTAGLALAGVGCATTATVGAEVDYGAPVTVVPADVYAYPRADYRGGYAYLVDGIWYYEGPRGWVTFRSEPPVLAERRVVILRGNTARPRYYEAHPGYYPSRPPPPPPRRRAPVERGRHYYPR